jgi:hypothetical protein
MDLQQRMIFHGTERHTYHLMTDANERTRVGIVDHGERGDGDELVSFTLKEFVEIANDEALEALSAMVAHLLAFSDPPMVKIGLAMVR